VSVCELGCGESKTRCGSAETVPGSFRDHFMTKNDRFCLIAAASINCDFQGRLRTASKQETSEGTANALCRRSR
jgi:hypothetical protein